MQPALRLQPSLAALTLVLLASCSSKSSTSATADSGRSGAELYQAYCALCHGADGGGTSMNLGPSYRGIAQYWDQASLLEYIADPQAYAAKHDRLGQREMTALPKDVSPEERERLVEHALKLMD